MSTKLIVGIIIVRVTLYITRGIHYRSLFLIVNLYPQPIAYITIL